jgi:hypothetical protein
MPDEWLIACSYGRGFFQPKALQSRGFFNVGFLQVGISEAEGVLAVTDKTLPAAQKTRCRTAPRPPPIHPSLQAEAHHNPRSGAYD